ncbi:MAG: peptidoglycan/xylan/chitin deacetylase (PgdA/CDA1 family) [Arenicella sp.]|jgi:peptidoglycan/xylan/chitin deacetylase (PgdA/CDA1 family)
MIKKRLLLLMIHTALIYILSFEVLLAEEPIWPKGKVAVSLSYDDALHSQLDNAIPSLDRHGFKASFYLVPTSDAFDSRLDEWRAIASVGHELGNHTLKHSCSGSLANRDWVEDDSDLDKQSVTQVITEIRIANTLLTAIDGKKERTFTVPCGDLHASGENYVEQVAGEFLAIKGLEKPVGFSKTHAPVGQSGDQLIEMIESAASDAQLINLIFHGIDGDYLSVSKQAHEQLLEYLAANRGKYWVDTYLNISKARKR